MSAFVLVTGAIVAVLLTSANAGGGVHAATVLTVTTPQAAGAVVAGQGTSENNRPTQTPASHTPAEAGPLSLVAEHGTSISAEVPAGWTTFEDEVQKSGYVESKWSNPADSNDTVLVDTSPATHDTLEQDAAPVHDDLLAASGYHELSYGPGNLTGVESWMWQFRISGDQRVDYFFNKCTSGFAVLGSTVPGRFNRLAATFRAVAESVQPGSSSPPC